MVDYDCLEGWLSTHLPAPGSLDALVIFTDARPLDQMGAWRHTQRLWQHRFSRMGPHKERWPSSRSLQKLASRTCTAPGEGCLSPKPSLPCDQPGTSSSQTLTLRQPLFVKSKNSSNYVRKSATTASRPGNLVSSWELSRIRTSTRALRSFLALRPLPSQVA